jgi:enoyl-CoA hydratase/carnithine racemase
VAQGVSVRRHGEVAVVTLHKPPHNLLTEPLLRRLADAVSGFPEGVRAAVVCSEGRSFCAGADFRSDDAPDPTDHGDFRARTGAFYRQALRIFASPLPLVAAVQGPAIGAGFGLAMACDLCVAGERAWFQANFVRLGIHPGFALSMTLPRALGPGRAADLLLTGRRVPASEAEQMGFVQRTVPIGDEVDAAVDLARELAAGAPLAVGATRATLRHGLVDAARDAMRHELEQQAALAGTADAIEGVRAMLAGRDPVFGGR